MAGGVSDVRTGKALRCVGPALSRHQTGEHASSTAGVTARAGRPY